MKEYQTQLVELLLSKNENLSANQAQTWIELLWDDFETTYAKAGREYMGSEMTERIVRQWVNHYGYKLHEFVANNPKYKHTPTRTKSSYITLKKRCRSQTRHRFCFGNKF